jgi:uncharacterized protein YecE (DUF72 family)
VTNDPGKKEPRTIPEPDPQALAEATELAARAPQPAAMGRVLLGTAGWTDRTLVKSGLFYPKGSQDARERLAYYAEHFRLVEVDATYYTLVAPDTAARWAEITPDDFRFDIKAHPVITGHPIEVARLPADLREALERAGAKRRVYPERMPEEVRHEIEWRFSEMLAPLGRAGKLASVFVQYPPWFSATRGNVRRIEQLAERWTEVTLAVEFRHKSWLAPDRRERVLDMLRGLGLSYVCVDEPDVERGGVPPVVVTTNPKLAIIRFHGHNIAGWQKRGASVHERFDYLYRPVELAAWVEPMRQLTSEAEGVHAIFNNCVRNYAVLGAKGLAVLLADGGA